MTAPAPTPGPAPNPDPPEPTDPPAPTDPPEPDPETSPAERLKAAERRAENERRARQRLEKTISDLRAASMSDQERAVAEAKALGVKEGTKTAGVRLAAAEFRAAAAGKLADPAAALEIVDLTKFVDDEGEPDADAIAAAVEKLAAATSSGSNGKLAPPPPVSKGIQAKAPDEDWLRSAMRG